MYPDIPKLHILEWTSEYFKIGFRRVKWTYSRRVSLSKLQTQVVWLETFNSEWVTQKCWLVISISSVCMCLTLGRSVVFNSSDWILYAGLMPFMFRWSLSLPLFSDRQIECFSSTNILRGIVRSWASNFLQYAKNLITILEFILVLLNAVIRVNTHRMLLGYVQYLFYYCKSCWNFFHYMYSNNFPK